MPARRSARPELRAGGGVVWRPDGNKVQTAVVHRPRYDDWSLPKGKLLDGETPLLAATREVREELGSRVAVSRKIGDISYDTPSGPKTVTYWVMRHLDGTFTPNAEVDAAEWLRPKATREQLTYAAERRVLEDFSAVPLPDSVLILVRHAKAGRRADWRGDDNDRPLDPSGVEHAKRLVPLLSLFAPDRIVSAEPVRCIDTVRPLADELGLGVQIDSAFGDEAYASAPSAAEDALMALAKPGRVTVISSQGDTIPGLIEEMGRGVQDSDTRKGAFWVLSIVDGNVVSTDYYEDALRG